MDTNLSEISSNWRILLVIVPINHLVLYRVSKYGEHLILWIDSLFNWRNSLLKWINFFNWTRIGFDCTEASSDLHIQIHFSRNFWMYPLFHFDIIKTIENPTLFHGDFHSFSQKTWKIRPQFKFYFSMNRVFRKCFNQCMISECDNPLYFFYDLHYFQCDKNSRDIFQRYGLYFEKTVNNWGETPIYWSQIWRNFSTDILT